MESACPLLWNHFCSSVTSTVMPCCRVDQRNDLKDWEVVARAHGERFAGINPANTLVEARLVGEGYLVEIEAEAVTPA